MDRELECFTVSDVQEALTFLKIGTDRRRKASMPLNPVSSRSHAIYQVIIDRTYEDNTRGKTSLYFADLMGSERMAEGLVHRYSFIYSMSADPDGASDLKRGRQKPQIMSCFH